MIKIIIIKIINKITINTNKTKNTFYHVYNNNNIQIEKAK